jgi:hypothetical protein
MLQTTSKTPLQLQNPICPECGDMLHTMANFCPRCMIPIFHDPNASEELFEISDPDSVDCYILLFNNSVVPICASPDLNSRRLFVMTGKDVVAIVDESQPLFYRIRTQAGVEGYVPKEYGLKVKVGCAEVKPDQARGYFRVNEYLIGWKGGGAVPYQIKDAPIKTEPLFKAKELARVKSDIVLPVVGEMYGWFEVQLPSYFRGWIPEAYGYRMLRPDSLPELTKPLSGAEIAALIIGGVAAVTVVGVGAAISAAAKD